MGSQGQLRKKKRRAPPQPKPPPCTPPPPSVRVQHHNPAVGRFLVDGVYANRKHKTMYSAIIRAKTPVSNANTPSVHPPPRPVNSQHHNPAVGRSLADGVYAVMQWATRRNLQKQKKGPSPTQTRPIFTPTLPCIHSTTIRLWASPSRMECMPLCNGRATYKNKKKGPVSNANAPSVHRPPPSCEFTAPQSGCGSLLSRRRLANRKRKTMSSNLTLIRTPVSKANTPSVDVFSLSMRSTTLWCYIDRWIGR